MKQNILMETLINDKESFIEMAEIEDVDNIYYLLKGLNENDPNYKLIRNVFYKSVVRLNEKLFSRRCTPYFNPDARNTENYKSVVSLFL